LVHHYVPFLLLSIEDIHISQYPYNGKHNRGVRDEVMDRS